MQRRGALSPIGTTNQLVAGVTLLVVSVWLRQRGRPAVYTLIPMIAVAGALLAWGEDRDNSGLLGAIGLGRRSTLSPQ